MRRCTVCFHPDRAAIDVDLLQGISLRTIAGRYKISPSALYRHRRRHMAAPTVGDILEPADQGDIWREWDGAKWLPIDRQRLEHLVEVKGRPIVVSWRRGWISAGSFFFLRKVYRRRQS